MTRAKWLERNRLMAQISSSTPWAPTCGSSVPLEQCSLSNMPGPQSKAEKWHQMVHERVTKAGRGVNGLALAHAVGRFDRITLPHDDLARPTRIVPALDPDDSRCSGPGVCARRDSGPRIRAGRCAGDARRRGMMCRKHSCLRERTGSRDPAWSQDPDDIYRAVQTDR